MGTCGGSYAQQGMEKIIMNQRKYDFKRLVNYVVLDDVASELVPIHVIPEAETFYVGMHKVELDWTSPQDETKFDVYINSDPTLFDWVKIKFRIDLEHVRNILSAHYGWHNLI
jgi:hypothetical protein